MTEIKLCQCVISSIKSDEWLLDWLLEVFGVSFKATLPGVWRAEMTWTISFILTLLGAQQTTRVYRFEAFVDTSHPLFAMQRKNFPPEAVLQLLQRECERANLVCQVEFDGGPS